jgi:hypothetical protein
VINRRMAPVLGLMAILLVGIVPSVAAVDIPLVNWSAPQSYTPAHPSGMKSLLTDAGNPSPLIPINPCRLADTRGFGFSGQAGPPHLTGGVARNFQIGGTVTGVPAQCGIPSDAIAVSFNFAVTNIVANGNLVVYPQGGAVPTVSSLNYQTGFAALSNAAVIPLGTSAGISVLVNGGGTVDVIIDVNGYFGPSDTSNRGIRVNSGTARSLVLHTTGSAEALDAFCDTAATNCWSILASAPTGDYAVVAIGGRGSSLNADDDGYPAVGGYWTGAPATTNFGVVGTTTGTGNCAAGVKGVAGAEIPCTHLSYVGVYGNSPGFWGVLGVSTNRGVQGSHVNASGTFVTGGVLGLSDTVGVYSFGDIAGTGAKSFVEPHPYDSTKQINFIAAEANEPLTMFRGRGRFQNGIANLTVPEEFQFVTEPDSLSIQITPIGDPASVAVTRLGLDGITVRSNRNVEFFYLVHGRRAGLAERRPIEENTLYVPAGPSDRMPNYPLYIQKRLVALGIYNQDGTVNMKTAETNGWAAQWRADAAAAQAAAQKSLEAQKALLKKDGHGIE